jgi:hypothetical protein
MPVISVLITKDSKYLGIFNRMVPDAVKNTGFVKARLPYGQVLRNARDQGIMREIGQTSVPWSNY